MGETWLVTTANEPPVTSPSIVLLTLARRIESELNAALAPLDLTVSRLGLLGHISGVPGVSFSDLARMSGTTVQSVHGAVKALAGAGLVLHRITRGYGFLGLVVPVVGIALALVQGRMSEIWLNLSMVLTAVAGGVLALQIYPRQRDALAEPGDRDRLRTLHMLAGIYNLLWAIVVILMIVRPGYAPKA